MRQVEKSPMFQCWADIYFYIFGCNALTLESCEYIHIWSSMPSFCQTLSAWLNRVAAILLFAVESKFWHFTIGTWLSFNATNSNKYFCHLEMALLLHRNASCQHVNVLPQTSAIYNFPNKNRSTHGTLGCEKRFFISVRNKILNAALIDFAIVLLAKSTKTALNRACCVSVCYTMNLCNFADSRS